MFVSVTKIEICASYFSVQLPVFRLYLYCFHFIILVASQSEDAPQSEDEPQSEDVPVPIKVPTEPSFDACCSYPCLNNGICTSRPNTTRGYECDCFGLEYYGKTCETATWIRWMKDHIVPTPQQKHDILYSYPNMWYIINNVGFIYKKAMLYVYMSREYQVTTPHLYNPMHTYVTLDSYYNRSIFARDLPPVPCNCVTSMGVAGPKELPSADVLYEKIFKRRKFKPDKMGTNMIFTMYAQHFIHQFFKTASADGDGITRGDEGVDASQVYGQNAQIRAALRSRIGGKLKTRLLDGEEYPPYLEDAPEVYMEYPTPGSGIEWMLNPFIQRHNTPKWALGHPMFGRSPDLFVMSTIWIREHNRVCDILAAEHPDWDDEQLYQTARLIILGEQLTITMSDYIQHMSQYKMKLAYLPEITHGWPFQYSNRVRHEFNYLYMWHQMVPEEVEIGDKKYNTTEWLYGNNAVVFEHGFDKVVEAFNRQIAGKITYRNHAHSTEHITKYTINESRRLRFQSFNNYRRLIGHKPYKTFEELTGERAIAHELRELYQDIEAVEFFVGLTAEGHKMAIVPPTMVAIAGPWAIKGVMANPIGSPEWWKPSTFGGDVGFRIVKEATLKSLFCTNMKNKCKGFNLDFRVPDDVYDALFPIAKTACSRQDL